MPNYIVSPNMSLHVPVVGSEAGPQYATDVNASLNIVDGHNHSPGSGVQITPSGFNINTALTFNSNPATNLSYLAFSGPFSSSINNSLYVQATNSAGDLWFTNGSGQTVQITNGNNVNATAAAIPGESYNSGTGTFTWVQGTGSTTPANFDIGNITIRPTIAGTSGGITLVPYSGIATAVSLVLPAIPTGTSFLTLDTSGNIVANTALSQGITASMIANNTITTSQISNTAGITGTQIASGTITGSNIASSTITASNISSVSNGSVLPEGITSGSIGGGGTAIGPTTMTLVNTTVTRSKGSANTGSYILKLFTTAGSVQFISGGSGTAYISISGTSGGATTISIPSNGIPVNFFGFGTCNAGTASITVNISIVVPNVSSVNYPAMIWAVYEL